MVFRGEPDGASPAGAADEARRQGTRDAELDPGRLVPMDSAVRLPSTYSSASAAARC